jgi:hypothetical protein
MEVIKKQFKLITTTASTACDSGTTGSCYIIFPDSGTTLFYNTKIMLTARDIEFGFFDVYEDDLATGVTGITISTDTFPITGVSSSRLSELRKFTVSGTLSDLYFTSTDPTVADGVNEILTSTAVTWTYYIGGMTYVDDVVNNVTTFSFTSVGYDEPNNFVNLPFIKDETKQNIIDKPEIDNNVFIIRQSLPVFQNVYRLQNIANLSELEKYAGGAKFNIVNNT